MKKLFLLLLPSILFSQVGINTTEPTKTLDINGQLRIRDIPTGTSTDYVIVTNDLGEIRKLPQSAISQGNCGCPILDREKSSGHYLLFKSSCSIPNPNNSLSINGLNFGSAGTWIENNSYYFSYTNTTGTVLDINNFNVTFVNITCKYNSQ